MAWIEAAPGRWEDDQAGDNRHILLRAGTRYVELHGDTVHSYSGPETPTDSTDPLAGTTWLKTAEGVEFSDGVEVWSQMESPAFTR